MTLHANSIPDDPEACRALIETQSETIAAQQQLIEKLQHEVGLLKRHIFGQRRERFMDPRPGQLFEIDQELEDALQSDEEDTGEHNGRSLARSIARSVDRAEPTTSISASCE